MAFSKYGAAASVLSVLGVLFTLLAFTTKSWLIADNRSGQAKFDRLGLWMVCFGNLDNPRRWYDPKIPDGCRWVLDKEYYIVYDILFCRSYIDTQLWFTACVLAAVTGLVRTKFYVALGRSAVHGGTVISVFRTGAVYIISAALGTIALVIFGLNGRTRGGGWTTNWEHTQIGWSYRVAVAGTVALYAGGLLYVIDGHVLKVKLEKTSTALNPGEDGDGQSTCGVSNV